MYTYDIHVMKVGNSDPRAGIEPTSLAFQASVLHLTLSMFLMSPLYSSMQLLVLGASATYYTCPPGFVSLLNGPTITGRPGVDSVLAGKDGHGLLTTKAASPVTCIH